MLSTYTRNTCIAGYRSEQLLLQVLKKNCAQLRFSAVVCETVVFVILLFYLPDRLMS